jgi:hypothetical protein
MRLLFSLLVWSLCCVAQAQVYKLKNATKDSVIVQLLYDSLPRMCDSFYVLCGSEKMEDFKNFVPDIKYLRATFDTLAIEYREEQVVYRQQMLLRNLQKDYKRVLKFAKKEKLKISKLEKGNTDYDFGKDAKGNEYCYVTVTCMRRKKEYELKYLAIRLNKKWFVGDELKLERVE